MKLSKGIKLLLLVPIIFLSFITRSECNDIKSETASLITILSKNLSDYSEDRSSTDFFSRKDVIDFANTFYSDTATLLMTLNSLQANFEELFTLYSLPNDASSYRIVIDKLIEEEFMNFGKIKLNCYSPFEMGFPDCITTGLMVNEFDSIENVEELIDCALSNYKRFCACLAASYNSKGCK